MPAFLRYCAPCFAIVSKKLHKGCAKETQTNSGLQQRLRPPVSSFPSSFFLGFTPLSGADRL